MNLQEYELTIGVLLDKAAKELSADDLRLLLETVENLVEEKRELE